MPSFTITFISLFKKACKYIWSHIYQNETYVLHVKNLNLNNNKTSVRGDGVEFAKVENFNDATFSFLKHCNPYLSRKIFEYELKWGHECFIGKKGKQVVFYVWTRKYKGKHANRHKSRGYPIADKKEIHFFHAVTNINYRGKNIYPAGIQFLENFYRKLGYEKISCTTIMQKTGKNASQKGLAKINLLKSNKQITMTKFLFYKKYRRNFSLKLDDV